MTERFNNWTDVDNMKDHIRILEQRVDFMREKLELLDKQQPVDSDLLDDAREVLEIIVHDQPVDTFRNARALIIKLRERLFMAPIINFTHPQPKCEPLTVRVWGWVWKDKRHDEDCYVPSYTPAQHVPRGELLALVDPADLHEPLKNTAWHTPEADHTIKGAA